MVMIQPDPALAATKTLQIESTQLLPHVLPTIAIGDIIKVTVRQNPQDGLGLIFFKGLLVKAALPKDVQVGDKLMAKITESNNNVVLKILERLPAAAPAGPSNTVSGIEADLVDLADQVGATQFRSLRGFEVKELLQQGAAIQKTVQTALGALPQSEQLIDPANLRKQLELASDGGLAQKFRHIAQELRTLTTRHGPPPVIRDLQQLRTQLTQLLSQSADNNREAASDIFRFLDLPAPDPKAREKSSVSEHDTARNLLTRAKTLMKNGELSVQSPEERRTAQNLIQQAQQLIASVEKRLGIDLKTADDVNRLATRFEQMAQTHESLARLNPVLQVLGEPALLLFPFLAQGLISHSEVTIESRRVKPEKEDEKNSKEKSEPYQRIQISVPLPFLGTIDVDVAHRKSEIFVRFTSEHKEVGAFLLEQLEQLAGKLRELGFERADLIAHVGEKQENLPAWSYGLHAGRSIVA